MILLISLLNGILWATLRRIYGGAIEKGILGNRGVQTVIMIVCMFPFLIFPFPLELVSFIVPLLIALFISCYYQFEFWSRAHGPCFDIANDKNPSPEVIERYKKMKGYNLLCKKIPEDRWYGFLFDYRLMNIRYTWPMLPSMFISPVYVLIGLSVAPIYAFCWALGREEPWLFEKFPSFCKQPTQLAEIITGFIFGFGIAYTNISSHLGVGNWLEYIQMLLSMI